MEAQHDEETNGSCEKGSSTLKLKLKMPKLAKEEDEEEKENNKVNVVDGRGDEDVVVSKEDENNNFLFAKPKKDHICCECGKEFSSGKALGGHMSSAHVQANQRLEESWKKKKKMKMMMTMSEESSKMMKRFEQDQEDEEDGVFVNHHDEVMEKKIICDLCGKIFPSKKSLFGHMRCHPDRDWRGMKPPSTSKKNAKNGGFRANFHDDYEDDDDVEVDDRFDVIREEEEEEGGRSIDVNVVAPPPLRGDLNVCLKSWGVKDRRGRSPLTKKRSVISTSSDEKELYDAVHQLIRLVHGGNNNNNNSEVMCSSNSVGSASKEASFNDLKDKSKRKMVVDETIEEENCGETYSNSPLHKKRRCENELVKPEGSKDPAVIKKTKEVKYKCNICDKSFASHQALGGHRSSHNKFKIAIENTIDHHHDHDHDQDVQLGDQEIQHGLSNNNNNVHKCKICDKIFSTGQALGGHQRSHWTNNQEDSSSQNASKVLDFDLNELPDLDDLYR
ncbi:hypothetical protein HAX54_045862 [Datura stramonium]|uniref:C2H2-type domain-containing protein n=1 Tax=Datura stramonium TaxID=4076 RepID=A0ABS8SQN6_DATST|nr:hypothetical protein [Datura stramonium]